jgi:hypothetical protein
MGKKGMRQFAHGTRRNVVIIAENYYKYYRNLGSSGNTEPHVWRVLMRDLGPKT